jgi:hypothetical protein
MTIGLRDRNKLECLGWSHVSLRQQERQDTKLMGWGMLQQQNGLCPRYPTSNRVWHVWHQRNRMACLSISSCNRWTLSKTLSAVALGSCYYGALTLCLCILAIGLSNGWHRTQHCSGFLGSNLQIFQDKIAWKNEDLRFASRFALAHISWMGVL